MANDLRICKACGSHYKYCPTCTKYASAPKWMWKCDTEECNSLFDAISAYRMNLGTEKEIKDVLDKYGIKDYSKFVNSIKNLLEALFPNKPLKNNKGKKSVEELDIALEEETDDYGF